MPCHLSVLSAPAETHFSHWLSLAKFHPLLKPAQMLPFLERLPRQISIPANRQTHAYILIYCGNNNFLFFFFHRTFFRTVVLPILQWFLSVVPYLESPKVSMNRIIPFGACGGEWADFCVSKLRMQIVMCIDWEERKSGDRKWEWNILEHILTRVNKQLWFLSSTVLGIGISMLSIQPLTFVPLGLTAPEVVVLQWSCTDHIRSGATC